MAYPNHPTRSISFPPRSVPTSLKIDESINKLRSFEVSTSSAATFGENIEFGLIGLAELYGYVQELMLLPSTQQALLRWKLAEEVLDGSVGLIDTCSSARDLVLRLKEQIRDLQSALRRRKNASIESELKAYMCFRKKLAKDVARCLRTLKQDESRLSWLAPDTERDHNDSYLVMVVKVLREVHEVTVGVFRRFYLFLLAKPTSTSTGWTMISRLVTKRSSPKVAEDEMVNEIAGVNSAICEQVAKIDVELVRGKLQALDSIVRILEGELESVFKSLVENRVSLLNILTH